MSDTKKQLWTKIIGSHKKFEEHFCIQFTQQSLPELVLVDSNKSLDDLFHQISDYWLSRKQGVLSQKLKELGTLSPEERPTYGVLLNKFKMEIEEVLADLQTDLNNYKAAEEAKKNQVDVSLPGLGIKMGRLHPITIVRQKIEDIFVSMGYSVEDGPEIDNTFYNFDALNIPPNHPARQSQDTFYVTKELALRSQTSNVQIHAMQRGQLPLSIIAPGRVFRRDTPDATHNPMFFQVEGLHVAPGITMGDLKGTLHIFLEKLFGQQVRLRFRPSYFPFVEPGAETDFECIFCVGKGCRVCKHSGWIELGGSGMVHPNVLRNCKIDPKENSGFAFGFGIDRMAAMLYGIDDIRHYYLNDARFLRQFV